MAEIDNLAYVVMGVSDLAAWERFATEVLGMTIGTRSDTALGLRMDEQPWRIQLERGPEDDLKVAGWECASEAELEAYVAELRGRGVDVREGSAAEADARFVSRLFACADPNGNIHEFFVGRTAPAGLASFSSPVLRGPGFKTGAFGIGHILPVARDYQQSVDFYGKTMGLLYSDRIREEIAPGIVADATFFHTRTGRHHSLATGAFPSPKRLNHLMVEYQDMNDVGAAYDRARAANVPIILELGHHPNDQMFSFYMVTPSGFGIETGHGGIVIEQGSWEPQVYDKMSDWGHKRNINTIRELATN